MPTTGPNLPELYAPGIELPITSHRPPEPFGKADYKLAKTPGVPDISQETINQLGDNELTFARHPRERDRHAPAILPMPDWFMENQNATLKIVCPISHGNWGPQVVLCEVVNPPRDLWKKMGHEIPELVVAKIFDALHYYDCVDKVAEADREYAAEAAAYMHLHDQRHTKAYKPGFVPQYFGSWTTDITLNHLRKPFMSEDEKRATAKKEAQARAAFDVDVVDAVKAADSQAETVGTEVSDDLPRATELKVHDFRPVRLVLLQHIKGTPLSRHLICRAVGHDSIVIEPKPDFREERIRTDIFGEIMDFVTRIEHLGIDTSRLAPSMFIIIDKEEESRKGKEQKGKEQKGKEKAKDTANDKPFDVVMTDFTEANVAHYTRMGYNIDQKLPLPMHPLSWGTPNREWYSFRGWIPAVWFDDVKKYDEWGEAYFESDNYSTPKVVNDICESVGWLNDMIKCGNIRPRPEDDPEWQALMAKNHVNMPEWGLPYRNEHGSRTKEEYDKHREQTAVAMRAARAEDKERIRKKRAAVRDKIKAQEQTREKADRNEHWFKTKEEYDKDRERRAIAVRAAHAQDIEQMNKELDDLWDKVEAQEKAKEEAAAKKAAVEQLEREMQAAAIAGASTNDPDDSRTPR